MGAARRGRGLLVAAKSPQAVRDEIAAYEQAGCDEVIAFPASADPAQVDRFAEAVQLG